MVGKIHILVIIFLLSFSGCTKLMTNNSKPFLDVQVGLVENTKSLNDVAKKVDILADLQKEISIKVGLGGEQYDNQKAVSKETKQLLAMIEQNALEAKKDREANAEILKGVLSALKVVGPIAGQAVGIPAPVTNAGLSLTEALLGAGTTGIVGAGIKGFLADRRRKKDDEDWQKHCEELEAEAEKEKQEMKKSLLIKQRRDGKLPPEHFEDKAEATRLAIEELTREGKI